MGIGSLIKYNEEKIKLAEEIFKGYKLFRNQFSGDELLEKLETFTNHLLTCKELTTQKTKTNYQIIYRITKPFISEVWLEKTGVAFNTLDVEEQKAKMNKPVTYLGKKRIS